MNHKPTSTSELRKRRQVRVRANRAVAATVKEFDPRPDFFAQLRRVIDFDLLKKARGKAASKR